MDTHTELHAHMHVHKDPHMHAREHMQMHADVCAQMNARAHTYICMQMHAHTAATAPGRVHRALGAHLGMHPAVHVQRTPQVWSPSWPAWCPQPPALGGSEHPEVPLPGGLPVTQPWVLHPETHAVATCHGGQHPPGHGGRSPSTQGSLPVAGISPRPCPPARSPSPEQQKAKITEENEREDVGGSGRLPRGHAGWQVGAAHADGTLPLGRSTWRLYNLQQLRWVTAGICSTKGLQGGERACLIPSRCPSEGSGGCGGSTGCVSLPPAPGLCPCPRMSPGWDGGSPRSGRCPGLGEPQLWPAAPGHGMWYTGTGP